VVAIFSYGLLFHFDLTFPYYHLSCYAPPYPTNQTPLPYLLSKNLRSPPPLRPRTQTTWLQMQQLRTTTTKPIPALPQLYVNAGQKKSTNLKDLCSRNSYLVRYCKSAARMISAIANKTSITLFTFASTLSRSLRAAQSGCSFLDNDKTSLNFYHRPFLFFKFLELLQVLVNLLIHWKCKLQVTRVQ